MSRNVFAISGWKNSGKDTVADFLVAEYGFTKLSFASKLKDIVAEEYGLVRTGLDDAAYKETPLEKFPVIPTDAFSATVQSMLASELKSGYWTPRALCILEGSMKRSVYSNHWVQRVANIIVGLPHMNFVISDLRYKTEADTLRMLVPNIKLIRINRFDSIETTEASERDMDSYGRFDYKLDNRRSVEGLYNQICNFPEFALDDLEDK